MKPLTISIIGGTGKMGQLFKKAFSKQGHKVIISGRNTKINNKEAAAKGDIVIISVPIRETKAVIDEIIPHIQPSSLLTDFTSVKVAPCNWMRNSNSNIVGGHPVFGPLKSIKDMKGQNFILCPIKGNFSEYKSLLESLGLNVIIMKPDEHDKEMAVIQCLNQLSNLAFGDSLKQLNFNLSNPLTSPNFQLRLYPIGRVLSQSEEMWADIETENPYSKDVAKVFQESTNKIKQMIEKNDKQGIENLMKETRVYFSPLKEESAVLTEKMLKEINKFKNKKRKD